MYTYIYANREQEEDEEREVGLGTCAPCSRKWFGNALSLGESGYFLLFVVACSFVFALLFKNDKKKFVFMRAANRNDKKWNREKNIVKFLVLESKHKERVHDKKLLQKDMINK